MSELSHAGVCRAIGSLRQKCLDNAWTILEYHFPADNDFMICRTIDPRELVSQVLERSVCKLSVADAPTADTAAIPVHITDILSSLPVISRQGSQ